jgi:hypothetical protein
MQLHFRDAALIGAVSGLLFYLNALYPGSYLYPLVWPLLGGVLAVYLGGRGKRKWPAALALALAVGVFSGVFFFLPGMGTLYALGQVSPESWPRLTPRGLSALNRIQVVNSAIFAFLAMPAAAVIGGGFTRLLLHERSGTAERRHRPQPA